VRKILVIDDDMRYQDGLLPFLQSYDFEVSEAATLSQGLRFLAVSKYDLLIIDGALPDGNGIDAIKTIRESGNNIPIIFISGVFRDEATADLLRNKYSVSMVKLKPIVPDELCREILDIFRGSARLKKPTFTFEKKNLLQAKPAGLTDFSQYRTVSVANQIEAVQKSYLRELPNELKQIRNQLELALHSPDQVDFDQLLNRVHNLKGTAGMNGKAKVGELMGRIENYITLFLACSYSDDSFEALILELLKAENEG